MDDDEKEINIQIMLALWAPKQLVTTKGKRAWTLGHAIIAENWQEYEVVPPCYPVYEFTQRHDLCQIFVDKLEEWDKPASSTTKDYASVCYIVELGKLVGIELKTVTVKSDHGDMNTSVYASPWEPLKLLRATPLQKCRAFLKAIEGKTRSQCQCGIVATEHCPEHGG